MIVSGTPTVARQAIPINMAMTSWPMMLRNGKKDKYLAMKAIINVNPIPSAKFRYVFSLFGL
ncbi:hypothetical protein D3C78_1771170 [compost metagenome]